MSEAQQLEADATQLDVERVLALLEAARPEVARRMLDAIRREIPLYRKLTDVRRLADVEAQCLRQIDMFLLHSRAGSGLAGEDLEHVRAATARRARELVPLDSLLHATRVGHRVAREWMLERVDDGPVGTAAALRLSDLGIEHADAVSTAIASEYVRSEGRRVVDEDRLHRDVLERLLAGAAADDGEAAELVLTRGLGEGPFLALVMATRSVGEDLAGDRREPAALLARALNRAGVPTLAAVRPDEAVVIAALAAVGDERVRAAAGEACAAMATTHGVEARVGISGAHPALDEMPLAYAEASRALRHARPGAAIALAEVPLVDYLLAEADGFAPRLVPDGVRRLCEEDGRRGGELGRTLEAFARRDLNAARTAEALFVHVNTVHYRLRRIAELTGLEPRRFDDLVQLLLALRLATAGCR